MLAILANNRLLGVATAGERVLAIIRLLSDQLKSLWIALTLLIAVGNYI